MNISLNNTREGRKKRSLSQARPPATVPHHTGKRDAGAIQNHEKAIRASEIAGAESHHLGERAIKSRGGNRGEAKGTDPLWEVSEGVKESLTAKRRMVAS